MYCMNRPGLQKVRGAFIDTFFLLSHCQFDGSHILQGFFTRLLTLCQYVQTRNSFQWGLC